MTDSPFVSVVMPVYNGEKYLYEAIESILKQTYQNFEFLIIDDGSSDTSFEIIKSFSDYRIHLLRNNDNMGIVYSLNRGIANSRGKYIVRMDCDDISLPIRIETQVNFMENNPGVGICGSSIEIFGDNIKPKLRRFEKNSIQNKANLLFFPVVAHPSVIMRKSLFKDFNLKYRSEFKNAEDYVLWVEASNYVPISNINKPLLKYRIVGNSVSRSANRDWSSRYNIHRQIYKLYFSQLGISLSEQELKMHFIISDNYRFNELNTFTYKDIRSYLIKLSNIFMRSEYRNYYQKAISKRNLKISILSGASLGDRLVATYKFLQYSFFATFNIK